MLTISQLASYAGCTVKAVRVYHQRGLLPEPARDASDYRRYGAQAVIDLTRIVTLARAGVPLAKIPALLDDPEYLHAIRLYDQAIDWDEDDPRIDALVDATAALAIRMSTPDELETWNDLPREAFDVLTAYQGDSAAWQTVSERVEQRLAAAAGVSPHAETDTG